MPNWLRSLKIWFSDYRWYRRWYGGKWLRYVTSLSMGPVWLLSHEHCGCGMYIIGQENYVDGSTIVKKGPYTENPKCVVCGSSIRHEWLNGDYSLLLCEDPRCLDVYADATKEDRKIMIARNCCRFSRYDLLRERACV